MNNKEQKIQETITRLQKEFRTIDVPEQNLTRLLALLPTQIPTQTTQPQKIASPFYTSWMITRVALPAFVAVLILGGFAIGEHVSSPVLPVSQTNQLAANTATVPPPPAPTGNINDAVAAFKQEQTQEKTITSQSENNKTLGTPNQSSGDILN